MNVCMYIYIKKIGCEHMWVGGRVGNNFNQKYGQYDG